MHGGRTRGSSAADTPHKINAKHMLPSLDEVNPGLWESKVSLSGDQTLEPMVNVVDYSALRFICDQQMWF
jgi:hypothetical protein